MNKLRNEQSYILALQLVSTSVSADCVAPAQLRILKRLRFKNLKLKQK